jgi:hypothetical protein
MGNSSGGICTVYIAGVGEGIFSLAGRPRRKGGKDEGAQELRSPTGRVRAGGQGSTVRRGTTEYEYLGRVGHMALSRMLEG